MTNQGFGYKFIHGTFQREAVSKLDEHITPTAYNQFQIDEVDHECIIGLSSGKYPVMLMSGAINEGPPLTELVTELFVSAFESSTWREISSISIEEIKFPRIGELWACELLFYDKDGKRLDPEFTQSERDMAGGKLLMHKRLVREGYLPWWYVCSPYMPNSEPAVWRNIESVIKK